MTGRPKGLKTASDGKYCQLLSTLKGSTDDFLYLLNIEKGEIFVRFSGRCKKKSKDVTLYEGFHRVI